MIDPTGVGFSDLARSAVFHAAAVGALGIGRVMQLSEDNGSDRVGHGVDFTVFWIDCLHPHSVKPHAAFAPPRAAPRWTPFAQPP